MKPIAFAARQTDSEEEAASAKKLRRLSVTPHYHAMGIATLHPSLSYFTRFSMAELIPFTRRSQLFLIISQRFEYKTR